MISAIYTGPLAPSIGLYTLMHCKLNRAPYAASTAQHPKRAKTWTPNVWQPPKISSAAEQNISAKKLIWHMQDTTDRQGSVQCLNGTESDSTASHWSPFCNGQRLLVRTLLSGHLQAQRKYLPTNLLPERSTWRSCVPIVACSALPLHDSWQPSLSYSCATTTASWCVSSG